MKEVVFKALVILLSVLVHGTVGYAQTTQSGNVKEYNIHKKKTPLGGVEMQIRNASSTVSDKNGNFMLEFHTLSPGAKVNVRKIEKIGYEIFNKEALEQWNINPEEPFVIVMVRSDKFKELRDLYSRESSKSYEAQYSKEKAALEAMQQQGKLTEEELRAEIVALREEYDRQLEQLDNYVDRFARIDLREMTKEEQDIISLVQTGKIAEAVNKYEAMKLVDKYENLSEEIGVMEEAVRTLDKKLSQSRTSVKELWGSIIRQLDTYMLLGGRDGYDKSKELVDRLMQCDVTDVWMKISLTRYLNNKDGLRIYESCDLNTIEDINEQLIARVTYGYTLALSGRYEDAYNQSLLILELAQKCDNQDALIDGKLLMADGLYAQFRIDEAISIYNELSTQMEDPLYADFFNLEQKARIYGSLAGAYQNSDKLLFLQYSEKSLALYNQQYETSPTRYNYNNLLYSKVQYGVALRDYGMGSMLGNNEYDTDSMNKSIEILRSVLPEVELLFKENVRNYFQVCVQVYRALAENYIYFKDYAQSEMFFLKAISAYDTAIWYNISEAIEINHSELYNNLGYMYYLCEEFNKSEQAYIKSIETIKSDSESLDIYSVIALMRPYINISVLYSEQSKYQSAQQYGYEGLKYCDLLYSYYPEMFNSEYVLILKTLATVEMHLNNNDNALSLIEKAIEANPNESELHNLRGLILKAGESINTL